MYVVRCMCMYCIWDQTEMHTISPHRNECLFIFVMFEFESVVAVDAFAATLSIVRVTAYFNLCADTLK